MGLKAINNNPISESPCLTILLSTRSRERNTFPGASRYSSEARFGIPMEGYTRLHMKKSLPHRPSRFWTMLSMGVTFQGEMTSLHPSLLLSSWAVERVRRKDLRCYISESTPSRSPMRHRTTNLMRARYRFLPRMLHSPRHDMPERCNDEIWDRFIDDYKYYDVRTFVRPVQRARVLDRCGEGEWSLRY